MIYIWLGVTLLFLGLEALTVGLTAIWFALGALAALISAAFHAPVWLQIVWFAVVSAAALAATRPLAQKYINARRKATNADSVIETEGVVEEPVDNLQGSGSVRAAGKVWTARSADGAPIPAGTVVRAVRIEGVKLIVEPVQTPDPVS